MKPATISDAVEAPVGRVKCNLCGADDYSVRFPKGFAQLHRIVICNQCGLMYANPQELVDCRTFESEDYPKVCDEATGGQYFQKQHVQLPDNLRALRVLNELSPKRGRLLEIGSFCGIFLDRIRANGWDATGLEPERRVADYSRSKYGLNIVDGVLPQPGLASENFDAVMMLHVIEHMPDPSENLREIHRILKPGGVLVVETPRFDSLMFKMLGRRERSLGNCNGHIYFFTVPALRRMFEKSGFDVLKVELVGRTLTIDRFFFNLGVISRSNLVKRWLYSMSKTLHLDRHSIHVNVRDMQRIYGRAK
jgi:2-polyprenyl-3-methyl-5-hydroxy-6-metoxy-1,4-benzoquinol methylase